MANPWFKIFEPLSGRRTLRLCVFHHAGGSSTAFQKWKKELPDSWGLVLVELPGRGARYREQIFENFSRLTSEMVHAFEETIEGPVILAGHSMGALLAFELYRGLSPERMKDVRGLLISSFLAPTMKNISARSKISHLDDETFLSEVRHYAEIPDEVLTNPLAKKYFLGLLRLDFRLLESYENSDFLKRSVPTLVFGGEKDKIVEAGRLEEWEQFVNLIEKPRIFSGDHFYISQHYQALIAAAALTFS